MEDSKTLRGEGPLGEDAASRLAASIRRLIEVTIGVRAPGEVLDAAADRIDGIAAGLRPHVPDPLPTRYPSAGDATEKPADFFPYDFVLGARNPLAPPVEVEWHDPLAVGRVRLGSAYEGPPGCVHGAVIAAVFDQIFNVANLMSGTAGPTARLELRYRRPTPLFEEIRFEGWVDRVEDRKMYTAGRLLAGDEVTVEASGLFILVPLEKILRMRERP